MNSLSNVDVTYSECSLVTTDDLIRFCGGQRSRSQPAVEVAKASTLTLWSWSPASSL